VPFGVASGSDLIAGRKLIRIVLLRMRENIPSVAPLLVP